MYVTTVKGEMTSSSQTSTSRATRFRAWVDKTQSSFFYWFDPGHKGFHLPLRFRLKHFLFFSSIFRGEMYNKIFFKLGGKSYDLTDNELASDSRFKWAESVAWYVRKNEVE